MVVAEGPTPMMLAITTFLIARSLDPTVPNDPSAYPCMVLERHIITVACPPGVPGPCLGTSGFTVVPAPVRAEQTVSGFDFKGVAQGPAPNQAIMGCCMARAVGGALSDCVVTGP